ncbi:MAG: hypothetical protein ACON4W_01325 [Parvibaculales bacterium]
MITKTKTIGSLKALALSLTLAPALMTGVALADDHKKKMTLREARKAFQARFDMMDGDKNGSISRAEFEATQPKFDNIDTDGDNAISKSELRSFLKSVRQKRKATKDKP